MSEVVSRRQAVEALARLDAAVSAETPMPWSDLALVLAWTREQLARTAPTPAVPGLLGHLQGSCADCGMLFRPTHDIAAPGPTVRHPFRPSRPGPGVRAG